MKTQSLSLFLLVLFSIVWLIYIAKSLLKKIEAKQNETLSQPNKKVELHTEQKEYKKILSKSNCNSTRKPKRPEDFNEFQNINNIKAQNIYRDKNGRFKSKNNK